MDGWITWQTENKFSDLRTGFDMIHFAGVGQDFIKTLAAATRLIFYRNSKDPTTVV